MGMPGTCPHNSGSSVSADSRSPHRANMLDSSTTEKPSFASVPSANEPRYLSRTPSLRRYRRQLPFPAASVPRPPAAAVGCGEAARRAEVAGEAALGARVAGGGDTSVEDCFPPDGTCATCSAKGWSAEQLAIGHSILSSRDRFRKDAQSLPELQAGAVSRIARL